MGVYLLGDGFEVGLDVGDFEDSQEELGIGVACEGEELVRWEEEVGILSQSVKER